MEPGKTEQGHSYNEHGIITSPGKFEGEPRYAPYFYEGMLDAGADEETEEAWAFHVLPRDVEKFPELADVKTVWQREDGNGFVHTTVE